MFASSPRRLHYAGQYVYLHVPSLSHWQWHPFSISSAPASGTLTLHIKNMGEKTFTGRLCALVRRHTMPLPLPPVGGLLDQKRRELRDGPLRMFLDGPYGRCSYVDDKVRCAMLSYAKLWLPYATLSYAFLCYP